MREWDGALGVDSAAASVCEAWLVHMCERTFRVEAGKVTPVIDRRYPLSEVPGAIRYLEKGHAKGKVVITLVVVGLVFNAVTVWLAWNWT